MKDRFQYVIGYFKDGLGGKIIIEFVGLRGKTYAYLMDDDSEHKKSKGTKNCVTKRGLMIQNYEDMLYTEQINKIALSSNDDNSLQTFDKFITYPYGTNAFKVCESEFRRNSNI